MKNLVLGGLGFIGSHVCDYLGEVSVYDIHLPSHSKYKCYTNNLDMLIQQSDIVYNFAGVLGTTSSFNYIQEIIETNITFATLVMEKCLEYKKILVSVGMPSEESGWRNPYSITKTCMRQFAKMLYERGLMGCTIIPYNVY